MTGRQLTYRANRTNSTQHVSRCPSSIINDINDDAYLRRNAGHGGQLHARSRLTSLATPRRLVMTSRDRAVLDPSFLSTKGENARPEGWERSKSDDDCEWLVLRKRGKQEKRKALRL